MSSSSPAARTSLPDAVRAPLPPDAPGAPRAIQCVDLDITERKRAQQQEDDFVSLVSHELRTPLTSIKGYLGLVLDDPDPALPEEARELLGVARQNADRLNAL